MYRTQPKKFKNNKKIWLDIHKKMAKTVKNKKKFKIAKI